MTKTAEAEGKMLWHYTVEEHLPDIIEDGAIQTTDLYIDEREKPVAWFSANLVWERTALKAFNLNGKVHRPETIEDLSLYTTPIRIGVHSTSAPVGWYRFKRIGGIKQKKAAQLERTGLDMGADPSQWYCSFTSVPKTEWQAIEVWNDGTWKPLFDKVA